MSTVKQTHLPTTKLLPQHRSIKAMQAISITDLFIYLFLIYK